jgi:hypothetical protein
MNVAIYGANGYLGSAFKDSNRGFLSLGRLENPKSGYLHVDFSFPQENADEEEFSNYLDLLRHRLKECSNTKSGYLYIGSISSLLPVVSRYGKRKRTAEELVLMAGGSVLRLGLVIDENSPGGRYKKLVKAISFLPVVPVTDPEYFQLFVITIENALGAVIRGIRLANRNLDLIADENVETNLGQLLLGLAKSRNKRVITLSGRLTGAMEFILRNTSINSLDPLKSLTVRRSITSQDSTICERDQK